MIDYNKIKNRYDSLAGFYDIVDWIVPKEWRLKAVGLAYDQILEAGIGTGLNLPFYSDNCKEIYGIDISCKMLGQAGRRVALCKVPVKLEIMDIQNLPLDSESFDCVVATFIFCTVADPCKGLQECYRVLKPVAGSFYWSIWVVTRRLFAG